MKRLLALDATMSPARALLALAAALILSVALTFWLRADAEGLAQEQLELAEGSGLGVIWEFTPETVSELADEARAVVEVEVEQVRAGEDLVAEAPGEPGGELQIPTQQVDVRTIQALGGTAPDRLTLFKLGSEDTYAEGDPPYEVGRRYVVFIEPRMADDGSGRHPDGSYLASAPDGRLLEQDGRLEPLSDGPVADELEGMTPAALERELEGGG